MHEVCINRLDISGPEDCIKTFLNEFHSEERGFSMSCIIPYNHYESDAWRHSNWGTVNDIFECSSYKEVMGSYTEKNKLGLVSISYLTIGVSNEVFVKKASKIYTSLKFTIYYYEPSQLFAGKTSFSKGLELVKETEYYEKDSVNKNNSIIDVYEFAIKEEFTSLKELTDTLNKCSSAVREHFYNENEEDDIVLDFETLKAEYMSENINYPKGSE